jgi:hypothetical protein
MLIKSNKIETNELEFIVNNLIHNKIIITKSTICDSKIKKIIE